MYVLKLVILIEVFSIANAVELNRNIFNFKGGIPLIYTKSCTTFLSKTPNDQTIALTASHCIAKNKESKFKKKANSSGHVYGISNSKKSIKLKAKNGFDILPANDQYAVLMADYNEDPDIFPMAQTLPQKNEVISIHGFANRIIGAFKNSIECTYLGTTNTPSINDRAKGKYAFKEIAKCSGSLSMAGMSGGPVLNSNNEVIGIFSAFVSSNDIFNSNEHIAVFSKVTKEGYSEQTLLPRYNEWKILNEPLIISYYRCQEGKGIFPIDTFSGNYRFTLIDGYLDRVLSGVISNETQFEEIFNEGNLEHSHSYSENFVRPEGVSISAPDYSLLDKVSCSKSRSQ